MLPQNLHTARLPVKDSAGARIACFVSDCGCQSGRNTAVAKSRAGRNASTDSVYCGESWRYIAPGPGSLSNCGLWLAVG
jgi:hypothetical protein